MNTQNLPTSSQWDPRFILDLALEIDDLDTILTRYGLSIDDYERFSRSKVFRYELANAIKDIRDNGLSFKNKARVQAESYLITVDEIVNNPSAPESVRLDAIKSIVRWGDLEPKQNNQDQGHANTVNIQINF